MQTHNVLYVDEFQVAMFFGLLACAGLFVIGIADDHLKNDLFFFFMSPISTVPFWRGITKVSKAKRIELLESCASLNL